MYKIKNSDLPIYKLDPRNKEKNLSLFKKSGLAGNSYDPKGVKVNKDEYCKSISYIKVLNNPKFKYDEDISKSKRTTTDRPMTVMSKKTTSRLQSPVNSVLNSPKTNIKTKNVVKKDVNELSFFKL